MKYSKYLVGLAIAVITMTMTSGKAQAQPLKVESINNINKILGIEAEGIPPFLAKIKTTEPELKVEPKPEPPQPKQYTVASGDNLSKIAEAHGTTWKRIYDKNPNIANQDDLKVGVVVTIPLPDEVIPERQVFTQPVEIKPSESPYVGQKSPVSYQSSGNTYDRGYCTAFVKDSLGWVQNGWGDAKSWASRASAQGHTISSIPIVGAVAQTTAGGWGHVAVVIGVGNGTVTIREMNYKGWNIVSERVATTSSFTYIYP